MKCVCKKRFALTFREKCTYNYEIYNAYTKDYLVYANGDDAYSPHLFDKYSFNEHFISLNEIRKNKLKKLNKI